MRHFNTARGAHLRAAPYDDGPAQPRRAEMHLFTPPGQEVRRREFTRAAPTTVQGQHNEERIPQSDYSTM